MRERTSARKDATAASRSGSPKQAAHRALRGKGLRVAAVVGIVGLAVTGLVVGVGGSSASASYSLLADSDAAKAVQDPQRADLQLGLRFSVTETVTVDKLRFLKAKGDISSRVVTVWDGQGRRLATMKTAKETASGWQSVVPSSRLVLKPGVQYTASYRARRYMVTEGFFGSALKVGPIQAPAGTNGVYGYGAGFPRQTYKSSNYWLDISVTTGVGTGTPATTAPATALPPAVSTVAPTPSTTPPGAPATSGGTDTSSLALPRVPWEGGSAFWGKFPKTAAAGWTDPKFFPIVSWFNGISSDAEVAYDKSLGFNTYIGMDKSTPYSLFKDNDVYWLGDALNSSFNANSKNWAGYFLDDEVDGRYSAKEGQAHLKSLKDARGADRMSYANFTQMIVSKDMNAADAQAYVNNYTDAISTDMYFYTIPFCDWKPFRENYINTIEQPSCRTASSYGAFTDALRKRDATDGKLQAIWQFVEILNGGPGEGPFVGNIKPDQLKGAVMSSIIREARGVVYFNQSLSGPCQGGNIIRQSQVQKNFCGAAQVAAAGVVNNQIQKLAPVLNTQSYAYTFGSGLNTMLKVYNGNAYIFAMTDKGATGGREFTLPAGISGKQVDVLTESRTLPVSGGKFSDSFASENAYHIYRIPLAG